MSDGGAGSVPCHGRHRHEAPPGQRQMSALGPQPRCRRCRPASVSFDLVGPRIRRFWSAGLVGTKLGDESGHDFLEDSVLVCRVCIPVARPIEHELVDPDPLVALDHLAEA